MSHTNNFNRVTASGYSYVARQQQKVSQAVTRTRRTYGWLCPFDRYKSNKYYNAQRHINLTHGYGSAEPINSSTGLIREQKRRKALGQDAFSTNTFDNRYNMGSSPRPPNDAQLDYDSDSSQSNVSNQNDFDTPILNDAKRRVKELGYYRNDQAEGQMIKTCPQIAYATSSALNHTIRPNF
jgi:hypothetical protein